MNLPLRWTRRQMALAFAASPLASPWARASVCGTPGHFVAEARRMRDHAVRTGDQAYGAVIVLEGCIVGLGPSRVVQNGDDNAHAERVALWDAQRRLGRDQLAGALVYSTSIPCRMCQKALATAGVVRMYAGPQGDDHGPPSAG